MLEVLQTAWHALADWYLARPLYLKTILGVCALLAAVVLLGMLKACVQLLLERFVPRRPPPGGGAHDQGTQD